MPRLTAGRGRGRERRKKRRQERKREGRGRDPKDEPDNMPRRIQRGEEKEREAEVWSELSNMPQAGLRRDAGKQRRGRKEWIRRGRGRRGNEKG